MKYLLLIVSDPSAPKYDPTQDNIEEWFTGGVERGIHLDGDRLRPPADATSIRVRDGEVLLTDGPFTESKEWIAGFDIIETPTLDEAIEYASGHPMAKFGIVEVRPFWPLD